METKKSLMAMSALLALAAGDTTTRSVGRAMKAAFPRVSVRKPSKRYPQMVTSTAEEIAEHNMTAWMRSRQVKRAKDREQNKKARRMAIAAAGGIRQFKRAKRALAA